MNRQLQTRRYGRGLFALLMVLGVAAPALAQNTAGRVDFAVGGVSALTGAAGVTRPLGKGDLVFEGDTVFTDATGRVQIRFIDGAYMSLQPQTEFHVDNYRYEGASDGKEKAFLRLLKGGLRTITGLIGKKNRDAYQVGTPVATIGIRGTEYLARLGNSLEVSVGEGSLFLLNNAGGFVINQGQSVYVANQNTLPVFTGSPPSLPPSPAQQASKPPGEPAVFSVGNQTTSTGTSLIVGEGGGGFGNLFAPGSGFALAVSHGYQNNGDVGIDCAANPGGQCGQPIVTLGAAGVSWVQGNGGSDFNPGLQFGSIGTAKFSGSSAGGVLGWGSFVNGTFFTDGGTKNIAAGEGIHFVMGIPTAAMPTSGTASMNLAGATQPTFSNGAGAGLGVGTVTSGTLSANFAANTVSTSFSTSFSGGYTYSASGSGTISGAGMGGTISSYTGGMGPVCYPSPCSGSFKGFFAGAGASYAGYVYKINVPASFTINGAIAFH